MGEETQPIAGLHRDIEELPHAELLTVLHENHDEQHLWDCIVAFEGYPFQTISGLPFTYQLKTGRNGELTKELWIDRRENSKSLAWSSVRLAFEKTEGTGRYPRHILYLRDFSEIWADRGSTEQYEKRRDLKVDYCSLAPFANGTSELQWKFFKIRKKSCIAHTPMVL